MKQLDVFPSVKAWRTMLPGLMVIAAVMLIFRDTGVAM